MLSQFACQAVCPRTAAGPPGRASDEVGTLYASANAPAEAQVKWDSIPQSVAYGDSSGKEARIKLAVPVNGERTDS
jgi:hypothetical protein